MSNKKPKSIDFSSMTKEEVIAYFESQNKQYKEQLDIANKKIKDQENIINSVITYINNETQIVNEIAHKTVAEILP